MTTEAEVRNAVECEHVPVGASVDIMACGATFDPRCAVFMKVRAFLICVAFEAGFVLEAS